jgi:hypothetical protein
MKHVKLFEGFSTGSAKKDSLLKFSDGSTIDTSVPLRMAEFEDGYYVSGKGMLIPIDPLSPLEIGDEFYVIKGPWYRTWQGKMTKSWPNATDLNDFVRGKFYQGMLIHADSEEQALEILSKKS